MQIRIGRRLVGDGQRVFVIAEAGVNHNGDTVLARKLIKAAHDAGADAVKFQTFRTDEVVTGNARLVDYQVGSTSKLHRTQQDMLRGLELDAAAHANLAEYARSLGICFLSTPGDFGSVDLLHALGVPAFKVGSDDLTNIPLLKYIASKGKPVLLSSGMATLKEIAEALRAIRSVRRIPVVIMHATSLYPCLLPDVNMRALVTVREAFKVPVGYSDHTSGVSASMAAVSLGACVIEKHLTMDRKLPGPDHQASYEPEEFQVFIKLIREVEDCLGSPEKKPTALEKRDMKQIRKGLVAACHLPKGTVLKPQHLAVKRPLLGLPPAAYGSIVGKRLKRSLAANTPVKKNDVTSK